MREHAESGGERCGSGLGAKHRGQCIGGAARRAGRSQIGVGVLKLFEGALERRQIVAQCAGDGLVERMFLRGVVLRLVILCHREKCTKRIMKTGSQSVN